MLERTIPEGSGTDPETGGDGGAGGAHGTWQLLVTYGGTMATGGGTMGMFSCSSTKLQWSDSKRARWPVSTAWM